MSKKFFEKAGKKVKTRLSGLFAGQGGEPKEAVVEAGEESSIEVENNSSGVNMEIEVENDESPQQPEKSKSESKAPPSSSDDVSTDDGWVITPESISRTLEKQQELIDQLSSNDAGVRMGAIKQLKVNLKFDQLFGLKVLDQLFSCYTQYNHNDLVEVEILKTITSIVEKSLEICIAKYSVHFFNFIKILTRCQKIEYMTTDNPLGKGNIFFLKRLLHLFMIDESSSNEDVTQIAFPIILEMAFENKCFAGMANVLLNNFQGRFVDSDVSVKVHLALLLDVFCKFFPEKLEKCFFVFYPVEICNSRHSLIRDVFVGFMRKHCNVIFKQLHSGLYPVSVTSDGSDVAKIKDTFLKKLAVAGFQKRVLLALDIVYYIAKRNADLLPEENIQRWTQVFMHRKMKFFAVLVNPAFVKLLRILAEMCALHPLKVYRQTHKIFTFFKAAFVFECKHDTQVHSIMPRFLAAVGVHLKNIEFAERIVDMLLELVALNVGEGNEFSLKCFCALENIVESKGKLVAVISKKVDQKKWLNHQNLQIRKTVARILSVSVSGASGGIIQSQKMGSQMMLEMQQMVDSLNLKIAEQNLSFAKLKTKVNELEKRLYSQ